MQEDSPHYWTLDKPKPILYLLPNLMLPSELINSNAHIDEDHVVLSLSSDPANNIDQEYFQTASGLHLR